MHCSELLKRTCDFAWKTPFRRIVTIAIGAVAIWSIYNFGPRPPKQTRLIAIAGTENENRIGDIVFVHGLNGDGMSTWGDAESDFYWPRWLHAKNPKLGIWSLDYDAFASEWLGGSMPIEDRATQLLGMLKARNFGDRPVIFVGHSLGGLHIKQMLRTARDSRDSRMKLIADRTRGVIFLATPHTGADIASHFVELGDAFNGLRSTPSIDQLQRSNSMLRNLNDWYRNNVDSRRTKTLSFFEQYEVRGVGMIVLPDVANPGIEGTLVLPVDADHISICKPLDAEADVPLHVANFIEDYLRPGIDSSTTLPEFVDQFLTARKANALPSFKEKQFGSRYTWKGVHVISVETNDENSPSLWIGATPDARGLSKVFAIFYRSEFDRSVKAGDTVTITGLFDDIVTNVTGLAVFESRVLKE